MTSLIDFLKFFGASPPPGLIIAKKGAVRVAIFRELEKQKIFFEKMEITENSAEKDFFAVLEKALKKKAWLALDIKTPNIPAWLYSKLRELSCNGHMRDSVKEKDYNVHLTRTRVLALMSNDDLEASPFDTLLSCFKIVFRKENNR